MNLRGDPSTIKLGFTGKEILGAGVQTTDQAGGGFAILYAMVDTVIDHITEEGVTRGSGGMDGATMKAGTQYFGKITEVKVTSGLLICYKA